MRARVWLSALALTLVTGPDLFAQTRRIVFRPGSTSEIVTGRIAAVKRRAFVLGARRGQSLSATLSSRDGCVEFYKGRGMPGGTSLSYTTQAGSNYIEIRNGCTRTVKYTLTVSIE